MRKCPLIKKMMKMLSLLNRGQIYCVCVCVCERESVCVCVCVCVCARASHTDRLFSTPHLSDPPHRNETCLITSPHPCESHVPLFNASTNLSCTCNIILVRLQHTATHCNTLQHTATHCNTLQHTATHCNTLQYTAIQCNILQHTATHCNTLHHTATHCNTRKHTATHVDTSHAHAQQDVPKHQ